MATELTAERARELFDYDPDTGILTRKVRAGHMMPGSIAGTIAGHGHVFVNIDNGRYIAHRVIWLMITGKWPEHSIDHINGKPADNRWCNLREASHRQNMKNQRLKSNNTSGFKGVSYHRGR